MLAVSRDEAQDGAVPRDGASYGVVSRDGVQHEMWLWMGCVTRWTHDGALLLLVLLYSINLLHIILYIK